MAFVKLWVTEICSPFGIFMITEIKVDNYLNCQGNSAVFPGACKISADLGQRTSQIRQLE